jgi:hypothetical protein
MGMGMTKTRKCSVILGAPSERTSALDDDSVAHHIADNEGDVESTEKQAPSQEE